MLLYYVLKNRDEDRRFFHEQEEGYFNFWNKYLILKVKNLNGVSMIIVNRTQKRFSCNENIDLILKIHMYKVFTESIKTGEPKEMFDDFPELNELAKDLKYILN